MVLTRSETQRSGEGPGQVINTTSSTVTTATTTTTSVTNIRPSSIQPPNFGADLEASGRQDESLLSEDSQPTIISPQFHSDTARGVREEFIQQNLSRHNTESQQQQDRAATGLLRMEIMRDVESRLSILIPRLVQESLSSFSPHTCFNYATAANNVNYTQNANVRPQLPPQNHNFVHPVPPQHNRYQTLNQHNRDNLSRGYHASQYQQAYGTPVFPPPLHQPPPGNQPPTPLHGSSKPIDKWGLKFDGTSKTPSVEDFVFQVKTLQNYYQCPWSEVIASFHDLVSGPALVWLWNQRRLNNIRSWRELEEALVSQFHKFEDDFDIQKKILDRRQQNQESFDDFCNVIMNLRNQQREPISEHNLVRIMKGNLKPAMAHLLFSSNINDLTHFMREGRRAENLLNSQKQFQGRYPIRQVNELDFNDVSSPEPSIDAIEKQRKLICWNCKVEGHTFMECKEERWRRFCYKCGLDDVVTPTCPVCREKNTNTNGPRTRVEARSQNNMTQ